MKRKGRNKSSVTQLMKVLCYYFKVKCEDTPIDVMREREREREGKFEWGNG